MANTKQKSAGSKSQEAASQGSTSREPNDSSSTDEAAARPLVFLPPLQPHRKLFVVMSIVLAIWLGFMLYLHFTTVGVPVPTGR